MRSYAACVALSRSEIVAAPSTVLLQYFSASHSEQSRKFSTDKAWILLPHRRKRRRMVLCKRFANIATNDPK
jgi:hypothetical protein